MYESEEFSAVFEDLASPFVKRRRRRQLPGKPAATTPAEPPETAGTDGVEGTAGSEEMEWAGEDERYAEAAAWETEDEWENERRKRRRKRKAQASAAPAEPTAPPGTDGVAGIDGVEGTEGSEEMEWAGEDEGYAEAEGVCKCQAHEADGEWEEEARYDEAETESEDESEDEVVRADLRMRIAAIAREEWQKWGQGTRSEKDAAMRPALRMYWQTVVKPAVVESQINTGRPWSAAFVSHVMRAAGAGNAFAGQAAHYLYVREAKKARVNREASKYQAFRVTEAKPEVGDVVCRDRAVGSKCGGTSYDNVSDGKYHATHCDLVTEVGNSSITVIGGNVGGKNCAPRTGCTVNARKVKLDSRGYVIEQQGGCAYFAVLKAPQSASAPAVGMATTTPVKASFALPSPRGYRRSGGQRKGGKVGAVVVHTTGSGLAAKAAENRAGRGRGCTTPLDCGLEYYARAGDGGFPHYLIGYDGAIYCTCPEDHVAWHAGWTRATGGKSAFSPDRWSAPGWWARVWAPAKSPLELLPPGASGPNSNSIGIELLGAPKDDAGFTEEQYRSLARLVVDIDQRHVIGITRAPSVKLLGHEDLNPLTGDGGRADRQGGWDPGAHRPKPRFDWSKLWALMQQGRTVRELEDEYEDENGPGDAESAFVGEAWETESSGSELEWGLSEGNSLKA